MSLNENVPMDAIYFEVYCSIKKETLDLCFRSQMSDPGQIKKSKVFFAARPEPNLFSRPHTKNGKKREEEAGKKK